MNRAEFTNVISPTRLTDSDHPLIIETARRVTENSMNDQDAAIKIFYYVRDTILFGGSNLFAKASSTLKSGIGDCGIKSNVQVSLLHASGIPARLRATYIKSEPLKRILPVSIANKMQEEEILHLGCECYLSGKWIACQTSYDKQMFEVDNKIESDPENRITSIDWDGEKDLILFHKWQTRDVTAFNSYDDFFEYAKHAEEKNLVPPRLFWLLFGGVANRSLNRHLDKLRKQINE